MDLNSYRRRVTTTDLHQAEAPTEPAPEGGIFAPAHRATTTGLLGLVSLHAFEALALTTVMPTIARELDGASLYATAFTATLAAGVVSIVWAGNLADRRGPGRPLAIGLVLFAAGLVLAGLAPTMPVLVAARVVQGLGAGMTSTALYVMVTRVYPSRLHTPVLAGFSAAWVVPSIVGPFVAGLITETLGWRWVFGLSLVVLVVAAALLARVAPLLRQEPAPVPWRRRALAASVVLATAVLVLGTVPAELDARSVTLALAAVVATVLALRPLLPTGTLRAARGLPSNVLVRGLGFAAFSGAEIYIPRLLSERDAWSPVMAGLGITLAGVTWFLGSTAQGRWERRFEVGRTVAFGMAAVALPLLALAAVTAAEAPAWVFVVVFPFVGLGLGTVYPRITAQALGRAREDEQGFVSSALQIGDSAGAAAALAISGIVFGLAGSGVPVAYAVVFAAMAVPAVIGWAAAHRIR